MTIFVSKINELTQEKFSNYDADFELNGSYLILNTNCIVSVYDAKNNIAKFSSKTLVLITSKNKKKITIVSNNGYCKIWALKIPNPFISEMNVTITFGHQTTTIHDKEAFLCSSIKPGFIEIFHALRELNSHLSFEQNSTSIEYNHMMKYLLIWFAQAGGDDIRVGKLTLSEQIYQRISQEIEKPWNLGLLSKVFFMSESTIKRRLRSEGTSFSNIYTDARMSYAQDLLTQPGMQVSTVAKKCGFTHVSYFVSCFKKKYGMTPAAYKRIYL
ncbi:TPA: helix-turn-helix domain-containing protein [Vibrio cholerae]